MTNKFKKKFNFYKSSSFFAGGLGISAAALFAIPSTMHEGTKDISNFLSNKQSSSATPYALANNFVPISNSSNSAPVSVASGFLGVEFNNRALVLTSYEGVIVWKHDLLNNEYLKRSLLNDGYTLTTTGYSVTNWFYLEEQNLLLILASTDAKTHTRLFAVDVDTGSLFSPARDESGNPIIDLSILKLNDGLELLVQNSNGDVIAAPFADYNAYSNNSQLVKVDSKIGLSAFRANFFPIDFQKYYGLTPSTGGNYYFAGLIPLTKKSNRNIMILVENTQRNFNNISYPASGQRAGYGVRLIQVKDDFSPYYNSGGSTISSIDAEPFITGGTFFNSLDKIVKYGYNYGRNSSNEEQFLWNTSGIWNSIDAYTINNNTNVITRTKRINLQTTSIDIDVISFVWNSERKRLYTSNSFSNFNNVSSDGASLGYFDLSNLLLSNIPYNRIIQREYGDIPTSDLVYIAPVVGPSASGFQAPIVVFEIDSSVEQIKGYYSASSSASSLTTVTLPFKTYNDILNEAKIANYIKDFLPSALSDNQLTGLVKFNRAPSSGGNFTTSIVTKDARDASSTLDVRYKVSYNSWWNTANTSSFFIDTHFSGFYNLDNYQFSFVKNYIGENANDIKFAEQQNLKSKTLASGITKRNVLDYFIDYDIITKDGANLVIDESRISLTPNDVSKTLTVQVDLNNVLPVGFPSDKANPTFTFTGFASFDGYTYKVYNAEEQKNIPAIVDLKSNFFPSSIDETDILKNFVELGSSYSKSTNDWTITIVPNDMLGELNVTMVYTNANVPDGFPSSSKNIMTNYKIEGFRSITSSFSTGPIMNKSTRVENGPTLVEIFNDYKALEGTPESVTTKLFGSISFPQIADLKMLEISLDNSSTANTDGFLDLSIKLKEGATTSFVVGSSQYVFDNAKLTEFETAMNGKYPFKTRWNVETLKEEFTWTQPLGTPITPEHLSSNFLSINLNESYFPNINKDMYADEVKEADIVSLYKVSNYAVTDTKILPDKNSGRLSVSLVLNSLSSTEVLAKTLEINGFKVPMSPIVIAIPTATVAAILALIITIFAYIKIRNRNLHKLVNNNMDQKYLDKMNDKNIKKMEKIKKRNVKLMQKKMKKLGKSK